MHPRAAKLVLEEGRVHQEKRTLSGHTLELLEPPLREEPEEEAACEAGGAESGNDVVRFAERRLRSAPAGPVMP